MAVTDPLINQLYDKLRGMYGQGHNELFQLEFPARMLEVGDYHYIGSDGPDAQQVKPVSVAEAEFRLVDGMLNLSNLVGGPNGNKLSESYNEVLRGLAPANAGASVDPEGLGRDQQEISDWLYEEIPDFEPPASDILSMIPGDESLPKKPYVIKRQSFQRPRIPRIHLYKKLLDIYEAERSRWAQFKNDARPQQGDPRDKWDAYDRLLAMYAPVIDARLEALWSTLIVRGQYHRVKKYMSYINKNTSGEALRRAKENLRASVMRSIDDTEDVYPVIFTPNNWAKHLSTEFRPEDLPRNQLQEAEMKRSSLTIQRNALTSGFLDVGRLEKAVADTANTLKATQATMRLGFSDTTMSCIQMYFSNVVKNAENTVTATKALHDANKDELDAALKEISRPPLHPARWTSLVEMQAECLRVQASLAAASDAYFYAQQAASQAHAADLGTYRQVIDDSIQSLTAEIEGYKKMLQASAETSATLESDLVPPPSQDGEPIWQYFVINSKASPATSKTLSTTSDSRSDYSTGLWFASGSGRADTPNSESTRTATNQNTDIQIGFRAMKVNIDRPWFDAQLLSQTKEFLHSNANSISAGKPEDVHAALARGEAIDGSNSIMPSWATAFVVVKDVHIIMSSRDKFDESEVSDMKNLSLGGGVLCFQAPKRSSTSDPSEAFSMKASDKNISIRIAAPQILGWISQLAPEDESVKTDTFNG